MPWQWFQHDNDEGLRKHGPEHADQAAAFAWLHHNPPAAPASLLGPPVYVRTVTQIKGADAYGMRPVPVEPDRGDEGADAYGMRPVPVEPDRGDEVAIAQAAAAKFRQKQQEQEQEPTPVVKLADYAGRAARKPGWAEKMGAAAESAAIAATDHGDDGADGSGPPPAATADEDPVVEINDEGVVSFFPPFEGDTIRMVDGEELAKLTGNKFDAVCIIKDVGTCGEVDVGNREYSYACELYSLSREQLEQSDSQIHGRTLNALSDAGVIALYRANGRDWSKLWMLVRAVEQGKQASDDDFADAVQAAAEPEAEAADKPIATLEISEDRKFLAITMADGSRHWMRYISEAAAERTIAKAQRAIADSDGETLRIIRSMFKTGDEGAA